MYLSTLKKTFLFVLIVWLSGEQPLANLKTAATVQKHTIQVVFPVTLSSPSLFLKEIQLKVIKAVMLTLDCPLPRNFRSMIFFSQPLYIVYKKKRNSPTKISDL